MPLRFALPRFLLLRRLWLLLISLLVSLTADAVVTRAADHFLTIGGGYSPMGNQISLEKNVLFFQRLLATKKPSGAPHEILFSDGNSPQRDLQFAGGEVPKANRMLAQLFHNEKYLGLEYRNHEVPGIRDGASRASLQRWFSEIGSKLASGDRLFLYVTAHGGKSKDKNKPYDTKLYLWNGESIRMQEFVGHLDSLPAGVSVVSVMVQCYSGGYAHTIFNDGDSSKGMSTQSRCGFYATVHDRVAAGCTPDVNEEDYQEFSSFFWAALGGETRTGKAIDPPDYDSNGEISFAEAFAYTHLASETIDIPSSTSGAFLRAFSKTESKDHPDLLKKDAPYEELLAQADAAQRAVLEGLSSQLSFSGNDRAQQAKKKADEIEKQRKQLQGQASEKDKKIKPLKEAITKKLKLNWPELGNLLNPASVAILTSEAEQFVAMVESQPQYSEMVTLQTEKEQLGKERLDLERRWAKCQRFQRTLEEIALAANLPKVATPELQQRFTQLLAAERSTLAKLDPAALIQVSDHTRPPQLKAQPVSVEVGGQLGTQAEEEPQNCR